LKDKLTKLGFIQSRFDKCVFYYGKTIFLVYTDDTILVGTDEKEIEKIVKTLSKNIKVEDQGDLLYPERCGTMGKWKEESGNIKNNTSIQHNNTHK